MYFNNKFKTKLLINCKTKNLDTQTYVDTQSCHVRNAFLLLEVPNEAELHCRQALQTPEQKTCLESAAGMLLFKLQESVQELAGFNVKVKKTPT